MVLPHASDLEEPLRYPFVAKAELVRDAATGRVARDDCRLDAVQMQLLEPVPQDDGDALGDQVLSRVQGVDPVADERGLERPPLDTPEAHLSDERAALEEQPEPVRGVEVTLPLPGAAAGTERLGVGDGIGAPGVGERLPGLEPVAASCAHVVPVVEVAAPQGAELDPGSAENRGPDVANARHVVVVIVAMSRER